MKAKLTDGTTIKLVQDDCGCVGIHDGLPHWLHMDAMTREINRRLLDSPSYLATAAFAKQERVRLREKLWHMNALGIVCLLPENEDERQAYC